MRKLLFPLLLVAVNLLGAALLAEIGIRAFADDGMQFDLEMWKYARDVKVISSDPLIGHEHAPNRKTKLMGVNFETNSQGLRDREFSFERTPGVLRIMMLGDSLTVGWGVNAEATFSKRLESLLNGNGTHAEVINAGAGNWNTIQEVQYFLTKGYKYRPDIIVLNYFLNDAEPVPHSRPPSFLMRHCYSCVFIMARADSLLRYLSMRRNWQHYYLGLYDEGRGPGWTAAKSALGRLSSYCKANSIRLIVASLPELQDLRVYRFQRVTRLVHGAANQYGVQFIDLRPYLMDEKPADLWVTRPDPHPNAHAHALIAEVLYSVLRQRNREPQH